jgi:predicted RNA-binding protein with EMAP domain
MKGVIAMIRISCERDYLAGWEKQRCARVIGEIIRELKELRSATNKEKEVEVNYSIIIK